MRELALPLSILVLAGVLALDHLPTAHAEESAGVLCTLVDRKGAPKNIAEEVASQLQMHAARGEVSVINVETQGSTFAWVACSWQEVD
jgi:hypothetical protein